MQLTSIASIITVLTFLLPYTTADTTSTLCSYGCIMEASNMVKQSFIDEDEESEDYSADYMPYNLKAANKACRIFNYTQSCIEQCAKSYMEQEEDDSTKNKTKITDVFDMACQSQRNDFDKAVTCYTDDDTVSAVHETCTEQCGGKNITEMTIYMQEQLSLTANSGYRSYVGEGLEQSCTYLQCWVPCAAETIKTTCSSGTDAAHFLTEFMQKSADALRSKFRLWTTRYWPKSCDQIVSDGFILPSETLATKNYESVTFFPDGVHPLSLFPLNSGMHCTVSIFLSVIVIFYSLNILL